MYSIAQNSYNYDNSSYYDDSFNNESWDTHRPGPLPEPLPELQPDRFIARDPDIICDDFKRVEVEGFRGHPNFHVDCQGYDIDGSELFTDVLKNCVHYTDNFGDLREWMEMRMEYYNETIYIEPIMTEVTLHDFAHCSQCNWCKMKSVTTDTISILEEPFATYIESSKAKCILNFSGTDRFWSVDP